MNLIREFFRRHKWERHIIVALLAMIAGSLAGGLLVPIYRDWRVIEQLSSDDQATRRQAINLAVRRATSREDTLRKLNDALDTENDQKFLAICSVLKQLKKFHTPQREGIWLDRWRCLQLEGMQKISPGAVTDSQPVKNYSAKQAGRQQEKREISAWARQSIMFEFVISGRDNIYAHRALQAAANDPAPRVREVAATLGAKFGQDAILRKLLADPDPLVQALAALDAGLAGRAGLMKGIESLVDKNIIEAKPHAAGLIVKDGKRRGGYPPPMAVAAVARWFEEPVREAGVIKTSVFYLREAIAVEASLPGDYVAWNIGTSARPEAFELGKIFLPGKDETDREYNQQVRSAGAMLLALSARTAEQKTEAISRISRRINRVDFFERGAMMCALLILGQKEYLSEVRELFLIEEFPRRRVVTALLAAGDKTLLDQMLWNVNFPLDKLRYWLDDLGLNEVFAATVPALPLPNPRATADTQLWQMRIMQQTYGICREKISVGLKRD